VVASMSICLIAAALHDRVELAAKRMAELGLKLVLKQRKFSDGFARHLGILSRYVFSIVIDTLDRKIIVPRPLTADRWAGADTDRIRWQVGDLPRRIVRLDLRRRGVYDRRRLIDLNRRRDSPQTHRNIDRGRLIELYWHTSQLEVRESRGVGRDGVIAR
jgi:hypothetical protein